MPCSFQFVLRLLVPLLCCPFQWHLDVIVKFVISPSIIPLNPLVPMHPLQEILPVSPPPPAKVGVDWNLIRAAIACLSPVCCCTCASGCPCSRSNARSRVPQRASPVHRYPESLATRTVPPVSDPLRTLLVFFPYYLNLTILTPTGPCRTSLAHGSLPCFRPKIFDPRVPTNSNVQSEPLHLTPQRCTPAPSPLLLPPSVTRSVLWPCTPAV